MSHCMITHGGPRAPPSRQCEEPQRADNGLIGVPMLSRILDIWAAGTGTLVLLLH